MRLVEQRYQVAMAGHGSGQPRCGRFVDAASAPATLVNAHQSYQGANRQCLEGQHVGVSYDYGLSDLGDCLHITAARSAMDAAIIDVGVGYSYSLLFATISARRCYPASTF